MKEITCIQQYVIDNLAKDKKLSTDSLIYAMSKICSHEQFNNILSIIIESPHCSITIPKDTELLNVCMYIPEGIVSRTKMEIIKILKEQFGFGLKETKDFVNNCIGTCQILSRTLTYKEIGILTKKLEPYNVQLSARST